MRVAYKLATPQIGAEPLYQRVHPLLITSVFLEKVGYDIHRESAREEQNVITKRSDCAILSRSNSPRLVLCPGTDRPMKREEETCNGTRRKAYSQRPQGKPEFGLDVGNVNGVDGGK